MKYRPELLQSPKVLFTLQNTDSLPKTPTAPRKRELSGKAVQFTTPIQRPRPRPRSAKAKGFIQAKTRGKEPLKTARKGKRKEGEEGVATTIQELRTIIQEPIRITRSRRASKRSTRWEPIY